MVLGHNIPDMNNTGYVAGNRYNEPTNRWELVGLVLYGVCENDCFGFMVDISSNSNILPYCCHFLLSKEWQLYGNTISESIVGFGRASVSGDGNTMALGYNSNLGYARRYTFNYSTNHWDQLEII